MSRMCVANVCECWMGFRFCQKRKYFVHKRLWLDSLVVYNCLHENSDFLLAFLYRSFAMPTRTHSPVRTSRYNQMKYVRWSLFHYRPCNWESTRVTCSVCTATLFNKITNNKRNIQPNQVHIQRIFRRKFFNASTSRARVGPQKLFGYKMSFRWDYFVLRNTFCVRFCTKNDKMENRVLIKIHFNRYNDENHKHVHVHAISKKKEEQNESQTPFCTWINGHSHRTQTSLSTTPKSTINAFSMTTLIHLLFDKYG